MLKVAKDFGLFFFDVTFLIFCAGFVLSERGG